MVLSGTSQRDGLTPCVEQNETQCPKAWALSREVFAVLAVEATWSAELRAVWNSRRVAVSPIFRVEAVDNAG